MECGNLLPYQKVKELRCKWAFSVKYKSDSSVERYKARLVVKGFTQTYGIDYQKTFALMAKLNTIQILLSLAANYDQPCQQLDIKNAFLNEELEEEVYTVVPPGLEQGSSNKVCQLKKALYGLKQSPRAWFERLLRVVKQYGYLQGHSNESNHTIFYKFTDEGKIIVFMLMI